MTALPEHAQRAHDRAIDYTGRTIAGVLVLSEGGRYTGAVHWHCRCACGTKFDSTISNLYGFETRGYDGGCEPCCRRRAAERRAARAPQASARRRTAQCTACGSHKHSRQFCASRPERDKAAPKSCRECEGMSWRRPKAVRTLCACGEVYAPEARR